MAVERFLPSAIAHFEPADLIGALTTGILVLDSDLCVVYANVAAQDLLAVSVNQARGKPFLSLVLEADSLEGLMRRALDTGETVSEREMSVLTGPLGRERRVIDITLTPLDSEFERKYLLLEIADATQRQRITRESELMARLDPPDVSTARARDQESARWPARRRAAAGARVARTSARIHRRHHQRGGSVD